MTSLPNARPTLAARSLAALVALLPLALCASGCGGDSPCGGPPPPQRVCFRWPLPASDRCAESPGDAGESGGGGTGGSGAEACPAGGSAIVFCKLSSYQDIELTGREGDMCCYSASIAVGC